MTKKDELVVTIRREGNAIFAICGDKTAKAVCSPDDEFDYITGAKLAFERLIAPKFKVGDIVIGLTHPEGLPRYAITGQKAISKVVAVLDETTIRVIVLHPNCASHFIYIGEEYCIDARTVKKWEGFNVGDIVAPIRNEDHLDGFRTAIITEIRKENNGTKAILKIRQNPSQYCCRSVATIRYATEAEEREFKKRFNEQRFNEHEFRVGDIVKVVDTGACFSHYYDWVVENITEKAQIARFAYGNGMGYPATKSLNQPFIVLYEKDGIAYISEDDVNKPCYVIGKRGLKHYPTR